KTRFRPQIDGFAFANNWTYNDQEKNAIQAVMTGALEGALAIAAPLYLPLLLPVDPFGLGGLALAGAILGPLITKQFLSSNPTFGLCGGMAYAALDYYKAGWIVPRGNAGDDQPQVTTPSGKTLREYIWKRLIDSDAGGGAVVRTIAWMTILKLIPSGFPCNGRAGWLLRQSKLEWLSLKTWIDAGLERPLGLIGTTSNPMDNHQVLAFGYDDPGDGTGTIYIYDSRCPGSEQTIKLDFRGQALSAQESCPSDKRGALQGFFCTDYSFHQPPVAVGLAAGLSASSATIQAGGADEFRFTATDVGYHASPTLALKVTGVSLVNHQEMSVPIGEAQPTAMAEGASRELVVSAKLTGTPGPWLFLASAYLGAVDGVQVWRGLPPVAQGASATVKVQTLPPGKFFILPVGEWDLNANGFKGILKVAAVDAQGNLNATVFGNQVAGFWDEEAKALVFVRPSDPNNPATFQFYTGYLFAN